MSECQESPFSDLLVPGLPLPLMVPLDLGTSKPKEVIPLRMISSDSLEVSGRVVHLEREAYVQSCILHANKESPELAHSAAPRQHSQHCLSPTLSLRWW